MPTEFQSKVYEACSKIPNGKVSTYKEIAKAIKNPNSVRAVGGALNKNPFAPKVPCHRVVSSNGKIGGFALGFKEKIKMLKEEGVEVSGGRIINFKEVFFKF